MEKEYNVLCHSHKIVQFCDQLKQICNSYETGTIIGQLNHGVNLLKEIPIQNKTTEQIETLLFSAKIQIEDTIYDIQHLTESVECNEYKRQAIESRLQHIYKIALNIKYSPKPYIPKKSI